MCFEKPPLLWLLETHVAFHYEGGATPAPTPQKLGHSLVSSAMVFNYDQRH